MIQYNIENEDVSIIICGCSGVPYRNMRTVSLD